MSRNNRITNAKAQKLRSGHTYWRCQIHEDGTVYINEEFLKGSKFTRTMRSMFPENVPASKRKVMYTSLVIGPKAKDKWTRCSYLSSVNPGNSINTFSTRRAALRWKEEVEAGLHPDAIASANEHWDWCNSMNDMFDDYDSYDYDYDGPDDYTRGYDDAADYSEPVLGGSGFSDYDFETAEDSYPVQSKYSEPTTLGELLRKKIAEQDPYDDRFALED